MKILLPTTMPLDPRLPHGWEAAPVDAREEIPGEHLDADALVVWGASSRHLASAARMDRLRLVQSLAAGVDGILAAGLPEDVRIASGAGLHSATVTEHTLALLLSLVRRLPEAARAQQRGEWSRELGGLQPLHPADGRVTTLLDARVLIWGFGEIGQHLAPLLAALGAQVTGVARTAGERAGFPVVPVEEIAEHLPRTDVLISILPMSRRTERAVDAEVLAALPSHALVLNVGRGGTLDQQALRHALEEGSIAGAALDVTDPEPLPADDPLWSAPNLLITPHAAGGRPVGADARIEHNVRALVEGTALLHEVR